MSSQNMPFMMTLEQERAYKDMQTPFCYGHPVMAVPPDEVATPYCLRTALSFPRFCELDGVVRKMIWAQAIADDPRVFEMRHPDLYNFDQRGKLVSRPEKLVKPRALTSTCVESRNQFQEIDLGQGNSYLINFNVDTIYFGPESYWFYEILWRPPPSTAAEEALYHGTEWLKQGWQKRQAWNHWRRGEGNWGIGEEAFFDECLNRDQTRHWKDPYHPFLSSNFYALERSQIKNVAFDLEFWKETGERRSGGQKDLLLRFPCAKKFILAAGDVGESMDINRTDNGPNHHMEETYKRRLTKEKTTAHPGVKHTGEVRLFPKAVQTPLSQEVIQILGHNPSDYPRPVTMCVTRDAHFNGHLSRFVGNALPPELEDDMEDDSDGSDDDPIMTAQQEDDDYEDDLLDRRRTLRDIELLRLSDDRDMTMQELQNLREELNPSNMTKERILESVRAFHESADPGRDEDTEDEDTDDEMSVEEVEEILEAIEVEDAENAINAIETVHLGCTKVAVAAEESKPVEDNKEGTKAKKTNAKKNTDDIDSDGKQVVGVLDSRLKYHKLHYKVEWQHRDGSRSAGPKWHWHGLKIFENCQQLKNAFHTRYSDKADLETERNPPKPRAPYGSQTKNGVKLVGVSASGSTPVPISSDEPTFLLPSAEQKEEANDRMDIDTSLQVGSQSSATLSPGHTCPAAPSSARQQNKTNDEMQAQKEIEVESQSSTSLSPLTKSPISPSSKEQSSESNDKMDLD